VAVLLLIGLEREQLVEPVDEAVGAAHQRDQRGDVVGPRGIRPSPASGTAAARTS
jgi:hypothetical protein